MRFGKDDCQRIERALALEWLETNGRGGFASGTVAGANTRRYHALLLTARVPPGERYVLVSHLEEWLSVDGESCPLSTNLYPGAVYPTGYLHCESFSSIPWPTWTFLWKGLTIQREVLCVRGRDIVIVRWKMLGPTSGRVSLLVRPMLTGRDYHALHHENETLSMDTSIDGGSVAWWPYHSLPAVRAFHTGQYRHAPDWYRQVQFPLEQDRGLESEEDWWSPGEFHFEVLTKRSHSLALTSEMTDPPHVPHLISRERLRRGRLLKAMSCADSMAHTFRQATESFLTIRGTRQTVIAGYPWFTDWGRDTFISLTGLCLVTGRHTVARHIIESFIPYISEGMVPNRFPDVGHEPEYNTIDASLWFVYAVDKYLDYTQDARSVRAIAWPAIKQILDGYCQGIRYAIHMDDDGLITGGVPGVQLTWMDARIGERVVTPRHGKPVEIQALWIRALEIGDRLGTRFGDGDYAAHCRALRTRAVDSFRAKFWNDSGGYLYDVVDGPEGNDPSMRPNQVYAIALCDDVVSQERAHQVLQLVKDQLLTPVGLRTLSPFDSRYCGRYEGGAPERDRAYHQGTVWPFLLGPFVTAWVKTYGKSNQIRTEARSFLDGLAAHTRETCIGHVSEIFDGDAPHHPRGCPAQAWSIAEPLRAIAEDLEA